MIRLTIVWALGGALAASAFLSTGVRADSTPVDDAKPADEWKASAFDYRPPAKLIVEESTPTDAQVSWWIRPPQLPAAPPDPKAGPSAKPREVGPLEVTRLTFRDVEGDVVPVLLSTPKNKKGPFPVVVAVHGLTSNKAQVTGQVGPALAKDGFAILALDLPCHGERPGQPLSVLDASNPEKTAALYRQAITDIRQVIDLAYARHDLDTRDGVTLVGYSLGSWLSSVAGPADPRVKRMVLMVGGAVDVPRDTRRERDIVASDPRRSLPHFAGRPLLLLNGKEDGIVRRDWADRLYAAAPEPKKQVWYDSGHLLPLQAYVDAADWIEHDVEKTPKK